MAIVLLSAGITGCHENQHKPLDINAQYERCNAALESCIINDFFAPPVASRNYAYPNLAAMVYLAGQNPDSIDVKKLFSEFRIDSGGGTADQRKELVGLLVFNRVGVKLVFDSRALLEADSILAAEIVLANFSAEELQIMKTEADTFVVHFMKWCGADKYPQTRTAMKYTLLDGDSAWKPTPPHYLDALEPHWNEIRPLLCTNEGLNLQYTFTPYAADTSSDFYKEVLEVYSFSKTRSLEDSLTARFWDCNPLVVNLNGHVTSSVKQLTPGGHWIRITRQMCRENKLSYRERLYAISLMSTTIFDSFICCWNIKYNHQLVRPVTVIRNHIDASWEPMLQTPNFPEFPSGHSVVSTASAAVLGALFGASRTFSDSAEIDFTYAPRAYASFRAAADEASISRYYGGIHYRSGIEQGQVIGEQIGEKIIQDVHVQTFKK